MTTNSHSQKPLKYSYLHALNKFVVTCSRATTSDRKVLRDLGGFLLCSQAVVGRDEFK